MAMTDILFTHSYFLRFDPKEFKAMMPYPPLGTLYAAAYLRSHGFSVALADSMLADDEEHIAAAIVRHKPRAVVIYDDDFNYLTKMCLTRMREAAFRMAEIARNAGCTVIVHGSDSADHIDAYLSRGADYVVFGEGEQTLLELLHSVLGEKGSLDSVTGLAWKSDGTLHMHEPRPVRQNLDELPFPAWDLVDTEMYRQVWRKRHGYFSINMVTTRGCPFHCNWCAKPVYGQVYNSRSPKNVVDEMVKVKSTLAPDHIWFCDDIFGLKPGWIQAFADEVQKAQATIPFKCLGRVDLLLKGDTIPALRRAGCSSVWVGAESGSQKILDAMEKGTTVAQIQEATRKLKAEGIRVGFFLQFGYPGETMTEIRSTLDMLKHCMPDDIGISVSYPLPGTPFYERVRSKLGVKTNWVVSEDLDLMFPGTYSAEFYRALHKVTHKRFRMWQGRSLLRDALLKPWTSSLTGLRRIASGMYHAATLPFFTSQLHKHMSYPVRQ